MEVQGEPASDGQSYQAIFEQSAVGVAQIETATGRFIRVNQHFCSMLGYTREEMLGMTFHTVTHPEDREVDLENRRLLLGGQIRQFTREKRYVRKDGSVIWIRLTVSAMWAPGETPRYNSAIVEDITEHKEAVLRLRDSEEKWKRLIELLPVGVTILDSNRRVIDMNPAIELILGVTQEGLAAGTYSSRAYLRPDGTPMPPEEFASSRALKENTTIRHVETGVVREDGQIVWLDVSAAALPFSDSACVIVSVDITERKRAEEALRRSQKMDALGRLTGGIAHDFNNQLGVILGNIEFMEDSGLDAPTAKRAAAIRKAAERAAQLTRNLLGFARGRPAHTATTDLRALIANLENLISRSLTPGNILVYDFAPDLWPVEIDPGDFDDALLNLLLNARDALPTGGTIRVKLSNASLDADYCTRNPGVSPGDYVRLEVIDTGHGMSKEVLAQMYEPFFTTKEPGAGTGLGLAMVFGFVKRSGGHINARSAPGHGTAICIYLPRSLSRQNVTGVDPLNRAIFPRGTESLLIADDEPALLEIGRMLFEALGYTVAVAGDGADALAKLARDPSIALLLTDVVMPGGMSGHQLALEARRLRPDLKVLITSGYAAENARAAESGAEIIPKPFRQSELAHRVRLLLDGVKTD
jgi:PAS domain S-box-containing protein